MSKKILVILPTYCEIEALPITVKRLHRAVPDADILVVDDASPDGTGEWADHWRTSHRWLHVIHRAKKSGLASAYTGAFQWGLRRGYEVIGQMDADGSHLPEQLPRLLGRLDGLDRPGGVIGSRWIPGGAAPEWHPARKALSVAGNRYIKVMLGVPVADATAGFRVYRAQTLTESNVLNEIESSGYAFQAEMTHRLVEKGFHLVEVPATFTPRLAGQSKMSLPIVTEELCQINRWAYRRMVKRRP